MLTKETASAEGIIEAFTPGEMYQLRRGVDFFGKNSAQSHMFVANAVQSKGYNPRIEQYCNFYAAVQKAPIAKHPVLEKYPALELVHSDQ